jgi:hypothetical protein
VKHYATAEAPLSAEMSALVTCQASLGTMQEQQKIKVRALTAMVAGASSRHQSAAYRCIVFAV